jgi:putative ABC transport system permease protein
VFAHLVLNWQEKKKLTVMFLSYLRLAFRLSVSNPFFTLINILGLSIGLVCFIALWEYSSTSLKADHQHKDFERIFRLTTDWRWTDDGKNWGAVMIGTYPSGQVYRVSQEFSEVQEYVRIYMQPAIPFSYDGVDGSLNRMLLKYETKDGPIVFQEFKGSFADPNLFNFFNIKLIAGDKNTCLVQQHSIVLSETTARKYFGNETALNKTLILNGTTALKVTGIFEDLPHNSQLTFDFVISNPEFASFCNERQWVSCSAYVKLNSAEFNPLEDKINAKTAEYLPIVFKVFPNVKIRTVFQPLTEVPFVPMVGNYFDVKSREVLAVMSIVSILILAMAWVNYINLSISKISARMKEIGARKVSGAKRQDFIAQYLTEACFINLIATAIAFSFLQFLKQPAKDLLNIHIPDLDELSLVSLSVFACTVLFGIFLTGIYPAIVSSRYSAHAILTHSKLPSSKRIFPALLTVFQYTIAIAFIFSGIIVHQQLNHVLNKSRGLDMTGVFVINPPIISTMNHDEDMQVFCQEVRSLTQVKDVSLGTRFMDLGLKSHGKEQPVHVDGYGVFENYLNFWKIQLFAGRDLRHDDRQDVLILSRLGAERLGFDPVTEAIGSKVEVNNVNEEYHAMEIVGLFEDFNLQPLFKSESNTEAVVGRGSAFLYSNKQFPATAFEWIFIKPDNLNAQNAIPEIEKIYHRFFPGNVFNAQVFVDRVNFPYNVEKITRNQITLFIGVAIAIACLGLLGMLSNKILERSHEIAIRKSLGADMRHVAKLLLRTTSAHLLLAVAVALPVANSLASSYLEKYAERIAIQWWHYLAPAVILVTFLAAAISTKLFQIARSNPVDSLRLNNN